MVELAIHQKPLHQVDMFLAGGAGAAERAVLDRSKRRYAGLRGLARLRLNRFVFQRVGGLFWAGSLRPTELSLFMQGGFA